ncbi:4-hydroxyproline epimerase [Vibrio coralliilyticus]|uniref:4-hydroxyproline epimerase n=1 Tax=Vibrio coralliilyticus TaxID=190893 RepID=UPI000C166A3D|nr:4-hydroxyproline epimerase [Vibrio coralliilyticus]
MRQGTFFCIDAHTCGNPVRLVAGGVPPLQGETMSEKRQFFLKHYDWIRQSLMFEPRGHAMMSGSVVLPPCNENADASILFIETSGCLPMCGHGTIGTVTSALEQKLITPREEGRLILDVPAGQIEVHYQRDGEKITSVKIFNVPAYLAHQAVTVDVEGLGEITVDVSYGGNYYVIVDPQENYLGLEHYTSDEILMFSPRVRKAVSEAVECIHPDDPTVCGVSHVLWTGSPTQPQATARNAVFYGEKALDRSPCGTGTSARMAQWHAKGKLKQGDDFIHESIIGSLFTGRIEGITEVNGKAAILPSIEGWAQVTGHNTIWVDDNDPYAFGFELK